MCDFLMCNPKQLQKLYVAGLLRGKLPSPNQTWCLASKLQFLKGVIVKTQDPWLDVFISRAVSSAQEPSFRGLISGAISRDPPQVPLLILPP